MQLFKPWMDAQGFCHLFQRGKAFAENRQFLPDSLVGSRSHMFCNSAYISIALEYRTDHKDATYYNNFYVAHILGRLLAWTGPELQELNNRG